MGGFGSDFIRKAESATAGAKVIQYQGIISIHSKTYINLLAALEKETVRVAK